MHEEGWDSPPDWRERTLHGHAGTVNYVAVSADGRRAVSASDDRTLKVRDVQSGDVLMSVSAKHPLKSCAIAPDGVTVLAGEQLSLGPVRRLRLDG